MKRILLSIFMLFVALFSFGITLKVGIFDEKPFYYKENDKYNGFVIDILKDIAKRENWNLTFVYGTREKLAKMIENNEIDLMPLFTFKEMYSKLDFNNEPIYIQWLGMVSKEKFDEPNMKNKIFIVKKIKDTIQIDKIFEKIGKKIILVSSFEEKLKALEEKKGDIAIIDTNDLENTLKLQGYNVSYYPLELYFNVSRNLNREIVNKLDDYIEKYKADKNSIYYESLSTDIYGMKYTMPIWILNISIFFLAIFLTVSLTLYIYRKKYKKTLENLKEQNEKYKKLSIENKKQFIRLSKIINIITEIAVKEESINKFSNRLLNELLEIIPEGKYGSVSLIKRDRIFFLSTVGHDIELLRKIHIINKDFYLNKEEFPNIEIIDDILNKTESELHEKFKKASKPIKRSIIYTNKIIDDLYLEICIDTDSDKNFSDNSIELTKVFGNLGIAYFKYKIALGKSISERRKAENANKAKTVFLSQMSHDIRTPINGIMGMIYIIEKTDLNTVQRKYLKMLKNSAKILADLINDILDLSKLEANEMIIEKKKFNLEKQVEKIIDANSFEAFSKGLELSYYIEDNVPKELIGDTIKLKQILNNLLNNAIKFTSIGEVKIYISMSKKKNIIIIFKIIDTGRGIKKEQIENIFKPFIQEDLTIYRKYGGTGLGLSIVRKLVDLLDGKIDVKSKVGEGTMFSVEIPFEISENHEVYNDEESVKFPDKNILIVDDNETNRFIIRKYLEKFHTNIDEAQNGIEALNLLKNKKYDLLLIDKNMPNMNGIELTKKINENRELKGIKKILLSSTLDDLTEIKDLNYSAIIPKPIKRADLIKEIIMIFKKDVLISKEVEKVEKNKNFKGFKVLLVEDNETNRIIGKTIIESFGPIVDLAESGEEAIEKIKYNKYDVIFMDIQMPIMDGYETTKIIKNLNIDIPIIAMTAYSLVHYKEKALKIGMDDFITKPIDPENIYEKLKKYYLIKKEKNKTIKENNTSNNINEVHFKKEEFLRRVLNKKELAKKILKGYLKDLEENLERLDESINKTDNEKIKFYAHTIKGASKNVSANKMAKLAEKIEKEYNDYKDFEELKKEYILLKNSIEKFLKELG